MSRVLSFVYAILAIIIVGAYQWMAVEILNPLAVEILDLCQGANCQVYGTRDLINHWFVVVTQWVPTIAIGGVMVLLVVREYRRTRRTQARIQRGP